MKKLNCSFDCLLFMPVFKLPAVMQADSCIANTQHELEQKYGGRMTLNDACKELGIKPDSVIRKIGNQRYSHYRICNQLERARVFRGKNTFFWTERIARILVEGNTDEISKFN